MHNDPTQIVDDAMTLIRHQTTMIGQQSAEIVALREKVKKTEWERDDTVATVRLLQEQLRMQNESFTARLSEVTRLLEQRDAELEELSHRLCDAEGALWRVAPNTHTIPSDHPLGKKTPDPFEGPGETYRAAYERVQSELVATRQELGETRLVLEQTERNADRLAAQLAEAKGERDV